MAVAEASFNISRLAILSGSISFTLPLKGIPSSTTNGWSRLSLMVFALPAPVTELVTDDVAIVSYDVVFRVPPAEDQGPPPRYQHFSTVWVKQSGEWKMKFQQMTASHWGDW